MKQVMIEQLIFKKKNHTLSSMSYISPIVLHITML